jgi:RluA family pseudouridine synthase
MLTYTVEPEDAGRRLREILRGRMKISFSAMKSAKWNGRILLNGEPAFVDTLVRAGDTVSFDPAENRPVYTPVPFPLALNIPWEDESLLIVDKPAPLASQSSAAHPDDSLENAVYAYLGCPPGFVYRPVNRLDRGTSGLMVVAKDGHTQDLLQRMLHTEDFRREYLALTEGIPSPREGLIDRPIAKENAASVRREIRPDGQPAQTEYRVVNVRDGRALVRLRLRTGRTHQIRVHLASLGCPVCGDFLYGTELPEEFPGRFALHSAFLTLVHPLTQEKIQLESLPSWSR